MIRVTINNTHTVAAQLYCSSGQSPNPV